jgi:TolA-binding protein
MKKIFIFLLPLPLIIVGIIVAMFLFRNRVEPEKPMPDPSNALFMNGHKYFQQGKYLDAIRAYQDFRQYDPKSNKAPIALFQIGRSYENLKLYLEASGVYESFLTDYSQNPLIPKVRLAKATMGLKLGELQKTEDELIDIINQYTDQVISSRAKHLLANCYYQLKDYKNAQKYYEMILSPSLPYLSKHQQDFLQLGEVYLANKEYANAKEVLLRLINIYPQSSYTDKALTLVGDAFYNEKEIDKALFFYGYAAQYYPEREWGNQSRLRMADLSLQKDQDQVTDYAFHHPDYSNPLEAYQEIAENSAHTEIPALAFLKLGTLLNQEGKYHDAYSAFKNIETKYIESKYYKEAQDSAQKTIKKLIDSLYYQNDFLSVVNFYPQNQAEIEQNSDPHLLFQVANSSQSLGLYALASNLYRKAAKCSSKNDGLRKEILLNLAETYNQYEKYGQAERVIGDYWHSYGKKINPCRAFPTMIKALYYQEKFPEAIDTHYRGSKLCPQQKKNLYMNYIIGNSYQKIGNTSEAKAYFGQALKLFAEPSDNVGRGISLSGNLPVQIGDSLYRAKDYKAAVEVYNKVLKFPGTKDMAPWMLYQLVRSYQKQGLKKEAREAYKKLLSQSDDPFWKDLAQIWLD